MVTRRRFLEHSVALSAAAGSLAIGAVAAGSATGIHRVAAAADEFVEFISVQTHLNWRNTVWDQEAWWPWLGDLGVRYTRSAIGNKLALQNLNALHSKYGIRSSVTFNPASDDGSFKPAATRRILDFIVNDIGAEKVYAIEGPNEYTHKYKTEGWAQRLRSYQEFLFSSVKDNKALSEVSVLAPTIWKRIVEDYEAIAGMNSCADYGNLHLYAAGRRPGIFNRDETDQPIDVAISEAQIVVPGKPIFVTETGYNVASGSAPTKWTVPSDVAAKYSLRNLAELFLRRDRVKKANIYSLIDDERKDDHFGLLDVSLGPRPAYWALRNLIKLIADPGPVHSIVTASIVLETVDASVRRLDLQKRDGRNLVLLWLDVDTYNRQSAAVLQVPPATVAIEFGMQVSAARVFAPTFSENPIDEMSGVSSMVVEVPDHLLLVELTP